MEENRKEITEKTLLSAGRADETPAAETVETPGVTPTAAAAAEITDTPAAVEKKEARRRKKTTGEEAPAAVAKKRAPEKEASPEVKKETSPVRLKASLRHGFQLKGRYYSRAELGRKRVLMGLWEKYPGLFEK